MTAPSLEPISRSTGAPAVGAVRAGGQRPAARGHVLLLFQPVVGGVPHYVAALAEELAGREWRVSVGAPSATPVLGRLTVVARYVLVVDTSNGPSPITDVRLVGSLVRFCRRHRVDVIHAHSSKAGALAALVGRIAGITSVYSPHGWSFERELPRAAYRASVAAERVFARRHERVIAVAEAERKAAAVAGVASLERVATVHTGLRSVVMPERRRAREGLGLAHDGFVVGWVGREGVQKRSEQLPQIASRLESDATLAVMGHGLVESAAGRELRELGSIVSSGGDPLDLYAACDAFAVTSRWEGFPLVVLEAMRAGLPVVAYDIGGVGEQVHHGDTGFLVEPGDAIALAERLRELARDPELTRRMGEAARRRFEERFQIDRMVDSIEEYYLRALAEPQARWCRARPAVADESLAHCARI
jgi:glycosyltransferase involved in cell wall biosynthesis